MTEPEKCPSAEFFLVCSFLDFVQIQGGMVQEKLRTRKLFTQFDNKYKCLTRRPIDFKRLLIEP